MALTQGEIELHLVESIHAAQDHQRNSQLMCLITSLLLCCLPFASKIVQLLKYSNQYGTTDSITGVQLKCYYLTVGTLVTLSVHAFIARRIAQALLIRRASAALRVLILLSLGVICACGFVGWGAFDESFGRKSGLVNSAGFLPPEPLKLPEFTMVVSCGLGVLALGAAGGAARTLGTLHPLRTSEKAQ